jgi:hypothetical protein
VRREGFHEIEVLAGKSLGTRSIAYLMSRYPELSEVKTILLTPIMSDPTLIEIMRESKSNSLVVIGTADPFYDIDTIELIQDNIAMKCYVVMDANHGLQIQNDLQKSLVVLQGVVQEISILLK